jgi:acetoin utilization protein AcuB
MTTRNLVQMRPEDELGLAMQEMVWRGARHLPVVAEGAVVGVLSERDILAHRAAVGTHEANRHAVRSVMSAPAAVVGPEDDIAEAASRMLARKIDSLPVVHEGELVGMITTTDLIRHEVAISAATPGPGGVMAAEVMTHNPVSVRPYQDFLDAVAIMVARNIRHIPVADATGRVVGMLSDRDVRTIVGDPVMLLQNAGEREEIRGLPVSAAMSVDPVVARENQSLAAVVQRFLDERVGAIAIVDDEEQLVGIISYLDALRALR